MKKTAILGVATIMAGIALFGCGGSEQTTAENTIESAGEPAESASASSEELVMGVPANELVPNPFDKVRVPEPIHKVGQPIKIDPTGRGNMGTVPITVEVTSLEWYDDLEGVEGDIPGAEGPYAVITLEWTNRSENVTASSNDLLRYNLHADPSTFGIGGYDVTTDTYTPGIYKDFQIQQGATWDVEAGPGETQEVVLVTDMEGEREELGLFVFIDQGSFRPIALVEI